MYVTNLKKPTTRSLFYIVYQGTWHKIVNLIGKEENGKGKASSINLMHNFT